MKKILLASAIISIFNIQPSTSHAQDNPVVMEVGGTEIRQAEFMKDFMNTVGNGLNAKSGVTAAEKREALDEYVDLYANFRAKVLDAKSMEMDKESSLLSELGRYRKELAAPYLIDSTVFRSIVEQAYDRNRYTLHAAHILVMVRPNAAPADTLAALERARSYRDRALAGEDFFALASEEVHRVNPNAKTSEYEGELNCFSAFDMVYPFEEAVYGLQVGEVSQPVRTRYGYHIIKLIDKVEHYGKFTLQHYWSHNVNDRFAADEAYGMLQKGMPFDSITLFSDDLSTAKNGGLIADAMPSQLPPEYVRELAALQEGEYSKPFSTRYGWHIVRLVKREALPSLESMMPLYRQRLARDPRGEASKKAFAVSARKKYGIKDFTVIPEQKATKGKKKKQAAKMMASLDELTAMVPDSVFAGKWRYDDTCFHDLRTLISVPGKDYNVLDVARFIARRQKQEQKADLGYYVRDRYHEFLDSVTMDYADSQLEKEHPDFADLIEEYRRGLMIFNYNEKMIWRKAIDDSVGFAQFYARESSKKRMDNPEDSIFFWQSRARVVVLEVDDRNCLAAEKAAKLLQKSLKKNQGANEMAETLRAKVDKKNCKSVDPVTYRTDLIEKGHQTMLSEGQWKEGVYSNPMGRGYRVVVVQSVLPPSLKEQMEARGYYLNAWQNEVERQLIADLRAKYNVKINKNVVSKLSY